MNAVIFFSLITLLVIASESKILPYIHEELVNCNEEGTWAGKMDYSNLQLIATSDTEVSVNGSIVILKEIQSPWHLVLYGEKYDRGSWYRKGPYKTITNFCKSMQDPLEPWYPFTKNFEHKECPLKAGVNTRSF